RWAWYPSSAVRRTSTCWPARWPCQSGTSSTRLATRGVSWTGSATLPTCHSSKRGPRELTALPLSSLGFLIAPVPLLAPWIAVHVVSIRLPEAGLVVLDEAQPAHPFGALPEVEVGHQQAGRPPMLGMQRLAVELERDPGLAPGDVLERQVGGVAAK